MVAASSIIPGLNTANKILDMKEFDEDEKDHGSTAFGALLWEHWEKMNGALLVGLFLIGVYSPRVAEKFSDEAKEKRQKAKLKKLEGSNSVKPHAPTALQQFDLATENRG